MKTVMLIYFLAVVLTYFHSHVLLFLLKLTLVFCLLDFMYSALYIIIESNFDIVFRFKKRHTISKNNKDKVYYIENLQTRNKIPTNLIFLKIFSIVSIIQNNSNNNANNDFLISVTLKLKKVDFYSPKESVDIFDIEIEKIIAFAWQKQIKRQKIFCRIWN